MVCSWLVQVLHVILIARAVPSQASSWDGRLPFLPHGFYTDTFENNTALLEQHREGFTAVMPWQNTPRGKSNATWAAMDAWLSRCDRVGVRLVWDLSHYVGFGIDNSTPPYSIIAVSSP